MQSLIEKRLVSFFAFAGGGALFGCLCLLVPLSTWAVYSDPQGSGSGFFIAILIFIAPISALPGALIAGLLALPIIDRALKTTTRSRTDYAAFLVAIVLSAFISIIATYITAWIIANIAGFYG